LDRDDAEKISDFPRRFSFAFGLQVGAERSNFEQQGKNSGM
jgi:hypothetical protein